MAKEKQNKIICDRAPYPWCNNGEGCDACEYREEE